MRSASIAVDFPDPSGPTMASRFAPASSASSALFAASAGANLSTGMSYHRGIGRAKRMAGCAADPGRHDGRPSWSGCGKTASRVISVPRARRAFGRVEARGHLLRPGERATAAGGRPTRATSSDGVTSKRAPKERAPSTTTPGNRAATSCGSCSSSESSGCPPHSGGRRGDDGPRTSMMTARIHGNRTEATGTSTRTSTCPRATCSTGSAKPGAPGPTRARSRVIGVRPEAPRSRDRRRSEVCDEHRPVSA
jgi:hypothetical protein